jgi:diguanylate cyclase (GGDEF)-like protein
MTGRERPVDRASEAAYQDDLALRLSGDSSGRAVLFALLILAFNIWDRFIDPVHADRALVWRVATAVAILMVHGLWVLSRRKSYPLYRWLVLTHTVTVPFGMTMAIMALDQGLLYGLSNFILLYVWIPSVLPSRRDALAGGVLAGLTIILVVVTQGADGRALGNIATLVGLGTVLAMMTATKFEAALRRAWSQERAAAHEARTDMLTGLVNRRHFDEAAAAEWRRCLRYGREAGLVVFDLDYFKQINDEHGHGAGDLVLRKVAEACGAEIREMDVLARIGGEEFALLLPETGLAAGGRLAERLRLRIMALAVETPRGLVQPTASFGVAPLLAGANDWQSALDLADAALYRAKQHGRNRVEMAQIGG